MFSKPDICIYHAPCTDGFTAAWAVWKRFGDSVQYIGCKYGDPAPDVTGKNVVLVDFSFKAPVLREMASKAASILILDHHKTAEADLATLFAEGIVTGIFDMKRSGAGIAWDYYHPEENRPPLINYVEDRDLWNWALPDSRQMSAYISSNSLGDFYAWNNLSTHMKDADVFDNMVGIGAALLRKLDYDVESLMAGARWVNIGGHMAPLVNANGQFASDLANKLSQIPGAPFGATYFDNAQGNRVFSLRSSPEKIDVSEIALIYGGGGHRNASGFTVPAPDSDHSYLNPTGLTPVDLHRARHIIFRSINGS